MDTVVAALIGVAGSILINAFVELLGWKKVHKVIGKSSSSKDVVSMLGNDDKDACSLSGEHKQLMEKVKENQDVFVTSIATQNSGIKSLIRPNTELLREINEREKKEQYIREEREKHLTPEQIEIKNALSGIEAMSTNWQKLNQELSEIKLHNSNLSNQVFMLNRQLDENQKIVTSLTHSNENLSMRNEQLQEQLSQFQTSQSQSFIDEMERGDEPESYEQEIYEPEM